MALTDLTFKLFEDAGLTIPFGGTLSVTHQSDLSDNSQDFVLYFGSNGTSVQLQASSNPGVDDVTLTPADILPEWAASAAKVLGDSIEPTVGNNRRYVVTTAGTTAASEPVWPAAIGSSVTDGSVVWTCVAETHEPTEIKLAATAIGLDSAVAAAALSLGNTVLSGTGNAKQMHIRITNAVTTVSSNTGQPEIAVNINNVTESAQ